MSEEVPASVPPLTAMPPTATESARVPVSVSHFADRRCSHDTCQRKGVYRMIGGCYNCGLSPLLGLFSVSHEASGGDCPVCGTNRLHWDRLATPDEIPASFEADL